MKAKETAEAVKAAAARLEGIQGAGIGLGTMASEELRAFAAAVYAPVIRSLYATPEGPRVLEHIDWHPFGVYVSAGTGYMPAEPWDDLSRAYDVTRREFVDLRPKDPTTCSECKGPLEDGMGCTPREDRCGSCVYEGAERARKARDVRADDEDPKATMRRVLAAEYQRQQGEGYGPGREE